MVQYSLGEIIHILKTLNDFYCLKSGSIICPKREKVVYREPFKGGFLGSVDRRTEVVKRLKKLETRQREILLFYYTFSKPVGFIASRCRISIRHFYRLKKEALEDMVNMDEE